MAASTGVLLMAAATLPLLGSRVDVNALTADHLAVASSGPTIVAGASHAQQTVPAVPGSDSSGAAGASCSLSLVPGSDGEGVVAGFLSPESAAALLTRTEASVGAKINPAFAQNLRASLSVKTGQGSRRVVALVPNGMIVKPGDRVAFTRGHRDMSLPCNYIPNLISTVAASGGQAP